MGPLRALVLALLAASADAFGLLAARPAVARRADAQMQFGWGGGGGGGNSGGGMSARDKDFARRQDRLASRQASAKATPKGQVTVTFPQKGGKTVTCQQGDPIGKVAQKGGLRIKFDCKSGKCGTCTVRLNGRSAFKICQAPKIPGGATKSLSITADNQ